MSVVPDQRGISALAHAPPNLSICGCRVLWLGLTCLLLVTGCASHQPTDPAAALTPSHENQDDAPAAPALPDYRVSGPLTFEVTDHRFTTERQRTVSYTLFEPKQPVSQTLVILGHGFTRSRANMRGFAEHFASWGLRCITLDFAHSRVWDANHIQNGRDMYALATEFHDNVDTVGKDASAHRRTIYVGYSAGGVAAIVAAGEDSHARGVLGLDLVAGERFAREYAVNLDVPLLGLAGEPSPCNARNNGFICYVTAPDAQLIRVVGSDHVDYESPTDALAILLCRDWRQAVDHDMLHRIIRELSTACLLEWAGADVCMSPWWQQGGARFDELEQVGLIELIHAAR